MTITLNEAISALIGGEELSWEASGVFKASTVHLTAAKQRRLADYLLKQEPSQVESADETLFAGLHAAWANEDEDPAVSIQSNFGKGASGPWRLSRIECHGFGGLNGPDGPVFEMDVAGENWCLEGYNGSGKTSLSSLVIWTLTGYRTREQDGPAGETGARQPVYNDKGEEIGTWLPLATYPQTVEGLEETAKVWARLTFRDPAGQEAVAERALESPTTGDPVLKDSIDAELLASPELIETGLLMPARIGHIGFGDKSQSLHSALKMLTGLDQLALLAIGAANFSHKSKRFLKYAKDNGADGHERDFVHNIGRAREEAKDTSIKVPDDLALGADELINTLKEIETSASTAAGASLTTLTTEISPELNLTQQSDRDKLNKAVKGARSLIDNGRKGMSLFQAWSALSQAQSDLEFAKLGAALETAESDLAEAVSWHEKQRADKRLRLKALAAQFYVPEGDLVSVSICPLCETHLTTEDQKALASELVALKADAAKASRQIKDACNEIVFILEACLPEALKPHIATLADMNPSHALAEALKETFVDQPPFSTELTGMASSVSDLIDKLTGALPDYSDETAPLEKSDIADVSHIQARMDEIGRVLRMSVWWGDHRQSFADCWQSFIGVANEDGQWPENCLEGKMAALEAAIELAGPLDKIAKHIGEAIKAAEAWDKLNDVQAQREAIAVALKPLKELQHLVDCETDRSVHTLSDRVADIVGEIQLTERLSYKKSTMHKKSVSVAAEFSDGLNIDATLVANASWMRALLWAFIFALREQTIEQIGSNPFPLAVLDDPQTTFDPKNVNQWAKRIVDRANRDKADKDGLQLFLTSHDRRFVEIVCSRWGLSGQQGEMIEPTPTSKVVHIVNGTFLERHYEAAVAANDNKKGYEYIQMVRVYCEDLLKIMLRPESYSILGNTLGKLRDLLEQLRRDHVAPYNRRPFGELIKLLDEKKQPNIKIIHDSHHNYDQTVGLAEAKDVRNYWQQKLQKAIVNAYCLLADYDAYGGAPYLFAWQDNVAKFPIGHGDKIGGLNFNTTGVAAAAFSDGRVGDGQIALDTAAGDKQSVTLGNHTAYRLSAGSLDPVAGVGDIIFVQEFGEPRSGNLAVMAFGDRLYARRMTVSPDHEDLIIFTGQSTDPYALPEPVIALKDKVKCKKVVGTFFASKLSPPPTIGDNEVAEIEDFGIIEAALDGVELFQVQGRSMEPIALEAQHIMTRDEALETATLKRLDGELVIAVDENGSVYFKRMRRHGNLIVLESANSSLTTTSELLSLEENGSYPRLTDLKSVVGVLFDLPGKSS